MYTVCGCVLEYTINEVNDCSYREEKNDFIKKSTKVATKKYIRSIQPNQPHHTPSCSLNYTPYQHQSTKRKRRRVRTNSQTTNAWQKQLLHIVFDSLIPHTLMIRSRDPSSTLHNNANLRKQQPKRMEYLPKRLRCFRRRYYMDRPFSVHGPITRFTAA